MVPIQGERAHFLYFWSFQNSEVGGQNNNNLLKVITFSTDYKYTTYKDI